MSFITYKEGCHIALVEYWVVNVLFHYLIVFLLLLFYFAQLHIDNLDLRYLLLWLIAFPFFFALHSLLDDLCIGKWVLFLTYLRVPLLGVQLSRYLLNCLLLYWRLKETAAARGLVLWRSLAVIVIYANLKSRSAHLYVVVPILVQHHWFTNLDQGTELWFIILYIERAIFWTVYFCVESRNWDISNSNVSIMSSSYSNELPLLHTYNMNYSNIL